MTCRFKWKRWPWPSPLWQCRNICIITVCRGPGRTFLQMMNGYMYTFRFSGIWKVQLDYLQVVKIHTHRYALEKIRPELIGEYCRLARKDLLSNFPYAEGKYILRQYASWKDQLYFTAICGRNIQLVKLLAGYQGGRGKARRKKRQLQNFEQISVKYGKRS